MCGIACIFDQKKPLNEPDFLELNTISEAMKSRGPDGQGLWKSPNQKIALAHRRCLLLIYRTKQISLWFPKIKIYHSV